jgi:hypothetical protein
MSTQSSSGWWKPQTMPTGAGLATLGIYSLKSSTNVHVLRIVYFRIEILL